MYTATYPPETARALAEEFGLEARIAVMQSRELAHTSLGPEAGVCWLLTAGALAAKAAHFAGMSMEAAS